MIKTYTYKIKPNKSVQIKFKGYTECLTTNPVAEYYHWYFKK